MSVKHEDFKTCDQSGFCKRNRLYADHVAAEASTFKSPYSIDADSVLFQSGKLTGTILKQINAQGTTVRLPLTISFLESGTARITIDEEKRQKKDIELRHDSKARKERYNEADQWAVVGGLKPNPAAEFLPGEGMGAVRYGKEQEFKAVIKYAPFGIEFLRDDQTQIRFNERGLMNVEHWRPKIDKPAVENKEGEENKQEPDVSNEDESTWWDEPFKGNTDTKPRGPESVALDISFPGYEHVFGIPEHASSLSLKTTRGGEGQYDEPYRLYNADVFEYILDSPMTLYGSIPLMQAHKKGSTVGIFWLNSAETWVDVIKTKESKNPLSLGLGAKTDTQTHWFSESGLIDVFVFMGPTPQDIAKNYGELTGYTQLPQSFAIAYHQCRWNYVTDDDVRDVDKRMDKFKIPYDVIWLDIEYTQEKKYFTFDPLTFGDSIGTGKQLDERERKLVVIIDPHIKNTDNYPIVDELKKKDLAVKDKDGNIFEGWCWPGNSHWVDAFNPAALKWWVSLFKYDVFKGTMANTWLWNDMNEPSVFSGPETTMPKDNLHHGNWEHRDVHNLNGLTFHNATYAALLERKKGEVRRPFILTRAFYAGSQRLGAMWTGDNQATWGHLAASFPMILNQGISGYPFAGADVGGFFGNPERDLFTRWYQAGAFYPFFRGHAHIDARRREPYLAGEPFTGIVTAALRLRYALLPSWYTAFHEASVNGTPIIRPHFFTHPDDEAGFALDDQFFVGSTGLLAKPVVSENAFTQDIYLPDDELYYDYFNYKSYSGKGMINVPAPLDVIPLLMRGGHIFPRKDRPRRSSGLMRYDPYTLVIVLGKTGNAYGELYVDDGETFDFEQGAYIRRAFSYEAATKKLVSSNIGESGKLTTEYLNSLSQVGVERIVIVGAPQEWATKSIVTVDEDGKVEEVKFVFHEATGSAAAWAEVQNPRASIGRDWTIDFS